MNATDVVVIINESVISCTEFHVKFHFFFAASVGLHQSGTVGQTSQLFDSFTQHSIDDLEPVEFSVNDRICDEKLACIGPDGLVMFRDTSSGTLTTVPNTATLRQLHLRKGHNKCTCNHKMSGNSVEFEIWAYDVNDRLFVMDIDGTVTKSDVRGYFETVVMGKYTYIHDGIVHFLNAVVELMNANVIFVTARPITHFRETRSLLINAQDISGSVMPRGPLFPNKEGTMRAVYQEVIAKTTVAFKSGILLSIVDAFKACGRSRIQGNPFILGVGNKPTDAMAYSLAGIPNENIFIIDTSSKIRVWQPSRLDNPEKGRLLRDRDEERDDSRGTMSHATPDNAVDADFDGLSVEKSGKRGMLQKSNSLKGETTDIMDKQQHAPQQQKQQEQQQQRRPARFSEWLGLGLEGIFYSSPKSEFRGYGDPRLLLYLEELNQHATAHRGRS